VQAWPSPQTQAVNFIQNDQPVFIGGQKWNRVTQFVAVLNGFQVKVKRIFLLANFKRQCGFTDLARPNQGNWSLAWQGLQYFFLSFSDDHHHCKVTTTWRICMDICYFYRSAKYVSACSEHRQDDSAAPTLEEFIGMAAEVARDSCTDLPPVRK
jgi:hypothetical protein